MGEDWLLGNSGDLVIGVSANSVANARISTQGFSSSAYDQSDGVQGTFGYFISAASNGHTAYKDNATALSGGACSTAPFNSLANAYMVQSGQVVGAAGTGRSYFMVTQVLVGSGATQGDKADHTATYVYSEV